MLEEWVDLESSDYMVWKVSFLWQGQKAVNVVGDRNKWRVFLKWGASGKATTKDK